MDRFFKATIYLLIIGLLGACSAVPATATPVPPTLSVTQASGFSEDQLKTLASLKQVDDHPLYTLTYYGAYASPRTSSLPTVPKAEAAPGWACSLFTVLLDEDHRLYGRNFDWQFSPAVLLFTDPPDGYASVAMVDMGYLGFSGQAVFQLTDLPAEELKGLLDAPSIPFDGMNEQGLAIGMAAVASGNMQADPARETIGSLGIIRQILDHARDVDEALTIFKEYNIDFAGGPPLHYLLADAKGRAVLVEFYQSEMHVFENEQPWHSATNFLRSSVEDPRGNCWRYDKINARLKETQSSLEASSAMQLLSEVAQNNTQWSVVYQMSRGEVSVAMGKEYTNVQNFRVSEYWGRK